MDRTLKVQETNLIISLLIKDLFPDRNKIDKMKRLTAGREEHREKMKVTFIKVK